MNQYNAATITWHHSSPITLFGCCHIILLSDIGTCVWTTFPLSECKVEQPGDKPVTCWLQVQHHNHYTTTASHYRCECKYSAYLILNWYTTTTPQPPATMLNYYEVQFTVICSLMLTAALWSTCTKHRKILFCNFYFSVQITFHSSWRVIDR